MSEQTPENPEQQGPQDVPPEYGNQPPPPPAYGNEPPPPPAYGNQPPPPPAYGNQPYAGQPPMPYPEQPQGQSNLMSILAMVCGVIAVFFIPILFGVAGIVLGIIAINKQEPKAKLGLGIAVAGMILGFILGAIAFHSMTS